MEAAGPVTPSARLKLPLATVPAKPALSVLVKVPFSVTLTRLPSPAFLTLKLFEPVAAVPGRAYSVVAVAVTDWIGATAIPEMVTFVSSFELAT